MFLSDRHALEVIHTRAELPTLWKKWRVPGWWHAKRLCFDSSICWPTICECVLCRNIMWVLCMGLHANTNAFVSTLHCALILPISSWCHNDVVRPKGLKRSTFQVDPLQGDVGAWRLHGRQGLSGDYQGQPWKEDDCCFTKGLSCCFDKNNWQLRYSNIWNTYGNINVISFDAKWFKFGGLKEFEVWEVCFSAAQGRSSRRIWWILDCYSATSGTNSFINTNECWNLSALVFPQCCVVLMAPRWFCCF